MLQKCRQVMQARGWMLLAFFLYALVNAWTMLVQGDDYIWNYVHEWDSLVSYRTPNGRYLGNFLSYVLVRYPVWRYIICTLVVFALFCCMAAIIHRTGRTWNCGWIVLALFLIIPTRYYMSCLHWLSAFPNYTISALFPLVFLMLCMREDEHPIRGWYWSVPLMLICGVAGSLCLESATIFQCLLAIALLVKGWVEKKKPQLFRIAYFVGVLIGGVCMFTNEQYYKIAGTGDAVGKRYFEIDPSTVLMHLYKEVITWFAKPYHAVNLAIALACLVLYIRADKRNWDAARKRYAAITNAIIISFSVYSLFICSVTNLESLTWSMRVPALEVAFAFLYVVSILYHGYLFLSKKKFQWITLFLCGGTINAAMFCVVGPVNMRCFFLTFCFWILVAGTLVGTAVDGLSEQWRKGAERLLQVVALTCACFVGYCLIVNRVTEIIRNDYLRQQLAEGKKRCEVIEMPYTYEDSSFMKNPYLQYDIPVETETADGETVTTTRDMQTAANYYRCMIAYWGFDIADPVAFDPVYISVLNYFT